MKISSEEEYRPLRVLLENKMGKSKASAPEAIVSALRAAANYAEEHDVSEEDWVAACNNAWAERHAIGD